MTDRTGFPWARNEWHNGSQLGAPFAHLADAQGLRFSTHLAISRNVDGLVNWLYRRLFGRIHVATDDVSLMRKKIVGYKRPSVKRATFFFFLPLNQYLFIACNAAARTRRVTSRTRRRVNQTPLRPFTTLVLRYF